MSSAFHVSPALLVKRKAPPDSTPVVFIDRHNVLQETFSRQRDWELLLSVKFPFEIRVSIKQHFKNSRTLFIVLSATANGERIHVNRFYVPAFSSCAMQRREESMNLNGSTALTHIVNVLLLDLNISV